MKHIFFCLFFLMLVQLTAIAHAEVSLQTKIPQHYAAATTKADPETFSPELIENTTRQTAQKWNVPILHLSWYTTENKLLAVSELKTDGEVTILTPRSTDEAKWLEKAIAYPTTPQNLLQIFSSNAIMADDDFAQKTVIFEAQVGTMAKGPFSKPYVFFPASADGYSGLTCYFKKNDSSLRGIKKGETALVRGVIKEFLMQDIILDQCTILEKNN